MKKTSHDIPAAEQTIETDWLAMPFRMWCRKAGFSPSHGYSLAQAGKLKITKMGGRSLITREESDRVLREGLR